MVTEVVDLRLNHLENPLGYQLNDMSFSWKTKGESTSVMVIVAIDSQFKDIIHTSGISKDINQLSYCVELETKPRTRYFWKVRCYNDDLLSYVDSETAWFETGKRDEPWQAEWITAGNKKDQSIIFRKDFSCQKEIKNARLYITGLGLYEAEINSNQVANEYLLPGNHAYDGYIQYQTFDITNKINVGENQIGVILGNGWYKGRFGFDGGQTNLYGNQFLLILEIHIDYDDGTCEIVKTDSSWSNHKSVILNNGIYDGEVVCGNPYLDNISQIPSVLSYTKTKCVEVRSNLVERLNLPIKIKEKLKATNLSQLNKNEWILDFVQNFAGWVEFNNTSEKGKKIVLKYAEHFQENDLHCENLRTARQEFVYHSMGLKQRVRPHFTYYGFRYVKITGLEKIDINDFDACVIYSDLKTTGQITTGNKLLNRFIENTMWSQKSNFIDVPTDCPQRDERMGWTGDAQIFSTTAAYNMDVCAFFTKYMKDLNYEQSLLKGAVPHIVPRLKLEQFNGFIDGYGASPWADAATIIPWNLYIMFGDLNLLKAHYQGMKAWVDYAMDECRKSGNELLWTTGFHFGDWLALDNYKNPYSPIGATESYFVASVYMFYSTLLVSKAAKALKNTIEYKIYWDKAERIKEAIRNEYFSPSGRITIDTQTARVLAITFDLLPKNQLVRIGHELAEMIADNGMHLDTGFVGTPLICSALTKVGQTETAYNLLLNEDYPGWLYEVKNNATTVWERWNSIMPDGKINEAGMNSLNHYAYGSIVEWIYKEAAGIRPKEEKPGFKEFDCFPSVDGRLKFMEASYESSMGKILSRWEILKNGELKFNFTVPNGSVANIRLPKSKQGLSIDNMTVDHYYNYFTLQSGSYEFIYLPEQDFLPKLSIIMKTSELLNNPQSFEIIHHYMGNALELEKETFETMSHMPFSVLLSDYHCSRYLNDDVIATIENELNKIKYVY